MRDELKNFTLLYAEDEDFIQERMSEYFKTYFKEVYLASDGKMTLDIYLQKRPDVVILDINMPIIDGLSVAREIRKKDDTTRIVMLSAHSDKALLLEATEINMSRYLIKPVDTLALKKALDKLSCELLEMSKNYLRLGEHTIWNVKTKQLFKENKAFALKVKDRKLLELLIKHQGRCVSKEEIMVHVWENSLEIEISSDMIKTQVNQLRKVIEKKCIESIYAQGYTLHEYM